MWGLVMLIAGVLGQCGEGGHSHDWHQLRKSGDSHDWHQLRKSGDSHDWHQLRKSGDRELRTAIMEMEVRMYTVLRLPDSPVNSGTPFMVMIGASEVTGAITMIMMIKRTSGS